jgi:hypothetical protein
MSRPCRARRGYAITISLASGSTFLAGLFEKVLRLCHSGHSLRAVW